MADSRTRSAFAFSASGDLKDYDDLLAKRAQIEDKLAAPYTKAVDTGLFFGTSTKELNAQLSDIDKRLDSIRKKGQAAEFNATHPVIDHHSGKGQFANVNGGLPALDALWDSFAGGDKGGGGKSGAKKPCG